MGELVGHLPFPRASRRDDEAQEDSRDCGVHAGVEHARPSDDSDRDEDPGPTNTLRSEESEEPDEGERRKEGNEVEARGEEESDDEDREQVIDDGESEEEGTRGRWHALAEDREDRNGKGDIGRCGDGPSAPRP